MRISWTYSRKTLRASAVAQHERGKFRLSNEDCHIGGLDRDPLFTHVITADGRLFVLQEGPEVELALIGGVDEDFYYANTATPEQLHTLRNILVVFKTLGHEIKQGDLKHFDLNIWLKAVSI